MLQLISLGIGNEGSLTIEALEIGKACQKLYLEGYTLKLGASKEALEKVFGKEIILLDRKGVEEGSLVEEARSEDIGLLVGGDALSATTHLSLVLDCKKADVPFRVVHGSSILTAVGECGLSLYKFGETVTVPRWQENFKPTSFYKIILKNKEAGLHTLILMEIDMPAKEALETLERIEEQEKGSLFKEKIIGISGLGREKQTISFSSPKELPELEAPSVLVVPGRLNEFEKEFLETL